MPVGLMREATPAGREGRSAVRMGNGARSGPQVTAPSGGDTQEMVLHDHTGSHPHREPAKGGRLAALPRPPCEGAATRRSPGQRVRVSGVLVTGLSWGAAWVFQI